MKSIEKLEKEIKKLDVDNLTTQVMDIQNRTKLETLKEVLKLIKEELKEWKDEQFGSGMTKDYKEGFNHALWLHKGVIERVING